MLRLPPSLLAWTTDTAERECLSRTAYITLVLAAERARGETAMRTTTTEITDDQIERLQQEAAQAGDSAQVAICERAMTGDDDARRECQRVVADAAAQRA
jgi:hypothetical protein